MAHLTVDALGAVYIAISVVWTVALAAGMLFLWHHRSLPCLQIRRLPLVFAAVSSLHVYGFMAMIVYVMAPNFPCNVEFWIMSIYLPYGIAMFHAANSQFLYIASRQRQYARMSNLRDQKIGLEEKSRIQRIIRGSNNAGGIDRMMVWIGIGLGVQLVLTLFIFFGSKKFHPGYGIFEYTVKGTGQEQRDHCVKGWEWWLSIVWQFFWAWVYAPYILWKSRGIRDVHGWRVQTICCCLVGLPASPLWIAGLYAPAMAAVNTYVPPPTWIGMCIFFMEIFTIAFPIFQVLKAQTLRQETLDAIASWEKRQRGGEHSSDATSTIAVSDYRSGKSVAFSTTTTIPNSPTDKVAARKSSFESQKSDMFTMVALENALRMNADPLLQFAALKDFSGENVSFLTHIAEWTRGWSVGKIPTTEERHKQFVAAVRIYAHFVSLEFSEFPINISSREAKHLHQVFGAAASILLRRGSVCSNDATPFDDPAPDSSSTVDLKTGINLHTLGRANLQSVIRMTSLGKDDSLADFCIPEVFGPEIFDSAKKEIKYLVLTNTWPKFVNAGFESNSHMGERDVPDARWWQGRSLC